MLEALIGAAHAQRADVVRLTLDGAGEGETSYLDALDTTALRLSAAAVRARAAAANATAATPSA